MGRPRSITPDRYDELIIALRDHARIADAAESLGVCRATIYNTVRTNPQLKWMAEAARAIAASGKPYPKHATESRYVLGCRCQPCTVASRDARRARRYQNTPTPRPADLVSTTADVYELAGPPPGRTLAATAA